MRQAEIHHAKSPVTLDKTPKQGHLQPQEEWNYTILLSKTGSLTWDQQLHVQN